MTAKINRMKADEKGFYGEFGGAFIPEMLHKNIQDLQEQYEGIVNKESFKKRFKDLLKTYSGRPTPLTYATSISKELGVNLYLKREDLNHTGAHKINNAIGQALLAIEMDKTRIIAETGAGQHGVATATVCALLDLECIVYMGSKDIERQSPNVRRMKMLGAEVRAVYSGSQTLKDATNEAIRDWINHPKTTHYLIGSTVGPHPYPEMVAAFQSIISEETLQQLGDIKADSVIACVGGGSNAAGAFFHFVEDESVELIAVEASGFGLNTDKTAASATLGTAGILHGAKTLLLQTDDGQIEEAHSISAGLDYPGLGPMHAHFIKSNRVKIMTATDTEALEAAKWMAQAEGIIPALETAHAIAALKKINFKPDQNIVLCLSGRGDKDMQTYAQFLDNE